LTDTFEKIRRGNSTLIINKKFRNKDFENALFADPRKLSNLYKLTPVNSSKFSKVYKFTVNFSNVAQNCFIKESLYRSGWDFIKYIFRSGRAIRDFKAALMLKNYGFNSPQVIALMLFKKVFFTAKSFLVTGAIDNAKPLNCFIIENNQLPDRRSLTKALGGIIGKMHNLGIFHGDMRMGNILVKKENSSWQVFFLDNERTKKYKRLPGRLRIKNLVQINIITPVDALTKTDRMRFLKYYLLENKELIPRREDLANEVMVKTNRRMVKIIQRQKNIVSP
jgi:hypothetical protein